MILLCLNVLETACMRKAESLLKAAVRSAGFDQSELYDVNAVARLASRNLISVYKDIRLGRLNVVRFGRTIRVSRAALEDYLAGGKQ